MMEIGSKVLQITEGRAYHGTIMQIRKNDGRTEARVQWHKGYFSWEPMVSLDLDEPYTLPTPRETIPH